MTYRINLNWIASINKIVDIEAGTAEEAFERALDRCVEHLTYQKSTPSDDSTVEMEEEDGVFLPDKPDSAEFFLEEEACGVI